MFLGAFQGCVTPTNKIVFLVTLFSIARSKLRKISWVLKSCKTLDSVIYVFLDLTSSWCCLKHHQTHNSPLALLYPTHLPYTSLSNYTSFTQLHKLYPTQMPDFSPLNPPYTHEWENGVLVCTHFALTATARVDGIALVSRLYQSWHCGLPHAFKPSEAWRDTNLQGMWTFTPLWEGQNDLKDGNLDKKIYFHMDNYLLIAFLAYEIWKN